MSDPRKELEETLLCLYLAAPAEVMDDASKRLRAAFDGAIEAEREACAQEVEPPNDSNKVRHTCTAATIMQHCGGCEDAVVRTTLRIKAKAIRSRGESWSCPSCGRVERASICDKCGMRSPELRGES